MKEGFWSTLSESARLSVEAIARKEKYTAGETVFLEGSEYRGCYVVESGLFKVYRVNHEGKEAILNFFFPGTLFAALPLLKQQDVYPAACEAVRRGELVFLEKNRMFELMKDLPDLRMNLQEDFLRNAEFFKEKTSLLMLATAEERVLYFLEYLGAAEKEVYLNLPKNQIALYLGITPEAFSRSFRSLKNQGIITEDDGYAKILQ